MWILKFSLQISLQVNYFFLLFTLNSPSPNCPLICVEKYHCKVGVLMLPGKNGHFLFPFLYSFTNKNIAHEAAYFKRKHWRAFWGRTWKDASVHCLRGCKKRLLKNISIVESKSSFKLSSAQWLAEPVTTGSAHWCAFLKLFTHID